MSDHIAGPASQPSGGEYRPGNGDGRLAQSGADLVDAIREQAATLRERVSDTVNSVAEDQKNRAADGVQDAAEATRAAARRLEGQNQSWMAGIIGSAADVLNDFSGTLRDSDFRSLYERVERFAREQPVIFTAGAFAAGMLLARTTRLGVDAGTPDMSGASGTDYAGSSAAGPAGCTGAARES